MSCVLIDDQGDIWDGHSRHARSAFDSPYSDGEFTNYVVRNLGFIAVDRYGTSCQLRMRPQFSTVKAVGALRAWLMRSRVSRIAIGWFDGTWSYELWPTVPTAIARLDEVMDASRLVQPDSFLARPVTSGAPTIKPAIADLVKDWPELLRSGKQDLAWQRVRDVVGDRFVVTRQERDSGKLVFVELGQGMFGGNDEWRARAAGIPIDQQPDPTYGQWVAQGYTAAVTLDRPLLEDVDAIVKWPTSGRHRLRYRRLILPMQAASGERFVLGGSLRDNRIDLRVTATGKGN